MDVDPVVMKESNTDKPGIDKAANDDEAVTKDNKQNDDRTDSVKNEKVSVKTVEEASIVNGVLDKELLEAFRYFDKNRVGYIKAQDLRCILHNLGKFMSNRHVKELVQSAILESNSGRSHDRVFYNKLVKMELRDVQ
ncbi:hypothetical protein ZIOFF_033806 [Zingiber officinale]|uniref:EF-hand domain-containing protein n=2 Tax=Zingiber officinale TaxID=94328 RepID=A0A8J5LCV3_ZINOF|nr:hypothetical protein ZIOFF_033806 [Zingiber officinale]